MFRCRVVDENGRSIGPILQVSGVAEEAQGEGLHWSEQMQAWARVEGEPSERPLLIENGVYRFRGANGNERRFVAEENGDPWSWSLSSVDNHIDAILGNGDSSDNWMLDSGGIVYDEHCDPKGWLGNLEYTGVVLVGLYAMGITPERADTLQRTIQSLAQRWDGQDTQRLVEEGELAAAADEQEAHMGM